MNIYKDLFGSYRLALRHITSFTVCHLLVRAVVAGVLLPLAGFLMALTIGLSDQGALTDQDIARFLLTPAGFATSLVALSLWVTGAVLDIAIMTLALRAGEFTIRGTIRLAFETIHRRVLPLALFCALLILRVLVLALPFLAVAGAVAYFLLTKYDINYYLTYKPPVFGVASLVILVVVLAMAAVLLWRLSGWAIALDLVLLGQSRPHAAFDASAVHLDGRRKEVILSLFAWGITRGLSWGIVTAVMSALIADVPGLFGAHLRAVATVTILLLVVWWLANAVISALCNGALADVMNRFYVTATGDRSTPRAPSGGRTTLPVWVLTTVSVALAGGAVVLSGMLLEQVGQDRPVEIIAHRGAAAARPENTLAAVEKALEDKADWVEIDVQESAEGVVIVAHDSDFMKLGGSPLKVWDATAEDLAGIDIGSWFDPVYADQRTPTLAEVLDLVNGRGKLIIELKYYGHDERLEQRVADLVDSVGMAPDVAIMSLKYPGIEKMQTVRPDWRTGVLATKAIGDLTSLNADFLAVNAGQVSGHLIRRAHSAGQQIYVWTVDDPVSMSRMVSMGVDGLITNEPALAREVLAARQALSVPERLVLWLSDRLRIGQSSLIASESDA